MIPIYAALILTSDRRHSWAAAILFAAAAITDQIDGYLARRWHVESAFGKIADPLADRLLIDVAVVLLWHAGRLPWAALADPGAGRAPDRARRRSRSAAATGSRSTSSASSRPGSSTRASRS